MEMSNLKISKHTWINELPNAIIEKIANEVRKKLWSEKQVITQKEVNEINGEVFRATNGRLCDLEDVIDINKYITN